MNKSISVILVIVVILGIIGASVFYSRGPVYKNEKYGFELTAPRGYEVSEASPENIQFVKDGVTFYAYVNLPTGFEGWEIYREMGDSQILVMSEEERIGAGADSPKYMFFELRRPSDRMFIIFVSSWLEKDQAEGSSLSADFVELTGSFKNVAQE